MQASQSDSGLPKGLAGVSPEELRYITATTFPRNVWKGQPAASRAQVGGEYCDMASLIMT
jgi:hypothetical protein